jgi:hypothetical protein
MGRIVGRLLYWVCATIAAAVAVLFVGSIWVWLQDGATSDRSGLGILVTGAVALAVLLFGRVSRYVLAGE